MSSLAQLIATLHQVRASLEDPPAGGDGLAAAVAAVRHFPVNSDAPGMPGVTPTLIPPDSGSPSPTAGVGVPPLDSVGPGDVAVSPPLAPPGPPGPPGDTGPEGPPGPPGPGYDPQRLADLEAAVADLQDMTLTALFLG